jgi:hypothetical protein
VRDAPTARSVQFFITMISEHATGAQRVGIFLAFVEAGVFGFVAALHFGLTAQLGGRTIETPLLFPAGVVEAIIAVSLLLAIALPGAGGVRVGRVVAAQILAVLAVFVSQVVLLRGIPTTWTRDAIVYGGALVLALLSLALLAAPAYRRRPLAR